MKRFGITNDVFGRDPRNVDEGFLSAPERFVSVEEKCIKFWKYENGILQTEKRIHLKQDVINAVSSSLVGFLIVLGRNGSCLVLDS